MQAHLCQHLETLIKHCDDKKEENDEIFNAKSSCIKVQTDFSPSSIGNIYYNITKWIEKRNQLVLSGWKPPHQVSKHQLCLSVV